MSWATCEELVKAERGYKLVDLVRVAVVAATHSPIDYARFVRSPRGAGSRRSEVRAQPLRHLDSLPAVPDGIRLAWFPHPASSWQTLAEHLKVAAALGECFDEDRFGKALLRAGLFKPRTREPIDEYLERYRTAASGDQPWRTVARMTARFFVLIGWFERCENEGEYKLTQAGLAAAALAVPSDEARSVWIKAVMALRLEPR